jgi:hypothetical protein
MLQRSAVESEGGHFYTLSRAVSELCNKIPVPDPLPAFRYAVLHGASDDEIERPSAPATVDSEIYKYRSSKKERPSAPQSAPATVDSDIYKYRSSKKERVFVPQLPTAPQQSADFLCLDVATSKATQEQAEGTGRSSQLQFHYQPLRLKQTVPNPKKIRRKQLKRMRQ